MVTDYEYLANSLAALAGMPVRLYKNGVFQHLYHHTTFKPDLAILEEPNIFRATQNVSYYMDGNFLCYGLFRVEKDNAALLVGPVAQMPVDKKAAEKILRAMGESDSRVTELQNYFSTIASYPLRIFLQMLCTINFFINGDKLDVGQLLLGGKALSVSEEMPPKRMLPFGGTQSAFELEKELLSCVEYGRTEKIRTLFQQPTIGRAGIIAADVLRQQKNLIICTTTLVTRAAIQGGLDVETAFALSDMYIQKAEMMDTYEELVRLNAQMILDFTARVENEKCGIHHSKLIRKTRDYVYTHIGEMITTEQLAREVGMNRTYLCQLFAEETGLTVNQYINQVKVEEAKRLMTITKKSVSEIADYLGYSSQSHFQRVFKNHTGITPGAYRTDAKQKLAE